MCVKRERSVWLLFGKIHRQCTRHDVIFKIGMRLRLHVCFSAHIYSLFLSCSFDLSFCNATAVASACLCLWLWRTKTTPFTWMFLCSVIIKYYRFYSGRFILWLLLLWLFLSVQIFLFHSLIRSRSLSLSLRLLVAISIAFVLYLSPRCVMQ